MHILLLVMLENPVRSPSRGPGQEQSEAFCIINRAKYIHASVWLCNNNRCIWHNFLYDVSTARLRFSEVNLKGGIPLKKYIHLIRS